MTAKAETPRVDPSRMANAIRALAMDAVEQAKSGHPGLPMGAADVATVLFSQFLKFDAADPAWPDRDRFVLSAGHGSMLLYALLYLTGNSLMTIDQLKRFRQLGSLTPGHPENFVTPGIETTTGPLGQGIATAVGMALAERHMAAEFGGDIVDHYTYVLASDGDLMEGISQEAIAFAGHLKLNKLIVMFDDNGISIDGAISLSDSVDQLKRFEAAGWAAERVDGHDHKAIADALARAQKSDRPTLIACKTIIAFGAPTKAGSEKSHGSPLGAEEIAGARKKLNWDAPPFEIPADILDAWRAAGSRGAKTHDAWTKALAAKDASARAEFERRTKGDLPVKALTDAVAKAKEALAAAPKDIATRTASEHALEVLTAAVPEMIGGSADLTGSNNTRVKGMVAISANNYGGRYVNYGIREHGMAAAMNGMTLHGGLIPYSGTFLVFSDYLRPALRAIPNLNVFRPCDTVETLECWQLALEAKERPSVLALTRQNLPQLRRSNDAANKCAAGAYEISKADGEAKVSIFASGSEVSLAVEAQKLLAARGIPTRVVSVPCMDLLLEGPEAAKAAVIGTAPVKVAVEAAIRQGWDAIIGSDGIFVGMSGFGASAPYKDLYKHFGLTAEAIADAAQKRV
jgi:transketolase